MGACSRQAGRGKRNLGTGCGLVAPRAVACQKGVVVVSAAGVEAVPLYKSLPSLHCAKIA